jgi:hypothetical protein
MLCLARRAAGEPHVVADHRHNRVIRETALARAIVIEYVTEP